ncbi:2-oxoacid:ferredoxin oxidoreductase subunit beta [Pyramidobacter sp. SM-530-WT-4B]|uniref:2-oxoacid:ferredoxin oxidoreductase subunit beta n=1 Tax=Pyramidobacter porci TaxID=2605789 RepID=A0A6L5Y9K9_9BACT|nr:thiamine pyrophosphate-dependent enzyme [Pyramidobacter porci]MST54795.1 2-oxoacid:ferredoxin oxidoreductase subunit beta [Pyramidobacter porci]
MDKKINPLRKYLREEKLPHFFCPGCGCGQVLTSFLRSVDALNIDLNTMVAVAGVGCTARIPVYMNVDMLHGVHGRTLPWATGIKLHYLETRVVVFAGDGDCASIGGNHLIHACRRNLDVLMVVVNNFNFAMTGGQVAPMTPAHSVTMTTPYGSGEPPFDICKMAEAAGATYVARASTTNLPLLDQLFRKGLQHKGFGLLEVISQCPTHYGRYALNTGDAVRVQDWMRSRCVLKAQAEKKAPEELVGKYVLGEFVNTQRPIFEGSSVYKEMED